MLRIAKRNRGFTLIELMIVVAIIGVLAVLAVYGVSKYLANAKTGEARANLGNIGKLALAAYEKETVAATVMSAGAATGILRDLCGSAASAVPSTLASVQGKKYQSTYADWNAGSPTTGFMCLKFSMTAPQYYQYNYTATTGGSGSYSATATGDLNGNGTSSVFTLAGSIESGVLKTAPSIGEVNPEE